MFPAKSQIVLGTASLGTTGQRGDAYRLLDAFVACGGTIIDTAAIYSDWVQGEVGRSESVIGEWLRSRPALRDQVMVVTKGGHPLLGSMTVSRLDREALRFDVEGSLMRLGLDTLPLYFLHRDDETVPVEEILAPLAAFVREGKVQNVGLSNWQPPRIAAALSSGLVPIASNQTFGNILVEKIDPMADPALSKLDGAGFDLANRSDQSLFLFCSQCEGFFGRRITRPGEVQPHYLTEACNTAANEIIAIAQDVGLSPTALAVRFLLDFSPRLFPIVGPRHVHQIETTMKEVRSPIPPAALGRLMEVSGFSAWE